MRRSDQQRITQHKRFSRQGRDHPNPSLTLRTSFMLGTLSEILLKEVKYG